MKRLDTFTNVHKNVQAGMFEPERGNALEQIVRLKVPTSKTKERS